MSNLIFANFISDEKNVAKRLADGIGDADGDVMQILKRYEKRFHDLVEGSLQGVMVTQGDKFVFANQSLADILWYSAEEILTLKSWEDLVAPDDRERVSGYCAARLVGDDAPAHYEYRAIRKDGTVIWLENLSTSVTWNDAPATQATVVDITQRKHAEAELRDALADAHQANRAKSEFLATMSHEFRTPLNAILGFSDMMRIHSFSPPDGKSYKDYAEEIHKGGQYMLSLVNDVLDFAAIESGKREITKSDIVVGDLLADAVKTIGVMAAGKDIRVTMDMPARLRALHADERACTQILHNLLSNAVKFTEPGGRITVSADVVGKELVIAVADTGCGIPEDKLDMITQPFTQVHENPHLAEHSTGLGLGIVKSLMDAHDGRLVIESEVGVGTRVAVAFPI